MWPIEVAGTRARYMTGAVRAVFGAPRGRIASNALRARALFLFPVRPNPPTFFFHCCPFLFFFLLPSFLFANGFSLSPASLFFSLYVVGRPSLWQARSFFFCAVPFPSPSGLRRRLVFFYLKKTWKKKTPETVHRKKNDQKIGKKRPARESTLASVPPRRWGGDAGRWRRAGPWRPARDTTGVAGPDAPGRPPGRNAAAGARPAR